MIRVIGLNPVIDRTYYIEDFCVGTKFYEIPPRADVGGKGINVARVLRMMGEPCVLYGFVGGNNGRLVEEEMDACHVEFRAFHTEGETRTTINIIDNRNGRETEITEPGVLVGEKEEKHFLSVLEKELEAGDFVICSGIPMKGMSQEIYRTISQICQEKGCKCALDAMGTYLDRSFPGVYYFSKPNFSELTDLFGIEGQNTQENLLKYGQAMQKLGVENLLISMGEAGGIFMDNARILQSTIPKVRVVSTIGCGDSSVAGFCLGAERGMEKEDCVRLAMACGACNAMFSKVGCVEPETVWKLFEQVQIQKISYTS
ncbi:MAG: 1-phosphofructokinase family hexose kinase [Lachnospiraceae bacterium]|jgi:1-phosphofructokinase family hexose kinase|nr:1-phosphofructokinase family hexose kinase [Lachnospiraceae bacterium]